MTLRSVLGDVLRFLVFFLLTILLGFVFTAGAGVKQNARLQARRGHS